MSRSLLRYALVIPIALAISLTLFWFMSNLIQQSNSNIGFTQELFTVELIKPKQEEPEPEPEPEPEQPDIEEPLKMPELKLSTPTPSALPNLDLPALDVGASEMKFATSRAWTPPGGIGVGRRLGGDGKGQGFREVVPIATRQPNIPDIAWENKIDGWVMVVISVNSSGYVSNVRIMDASPRGVFEENVVLAVKDWQYEMNGQKSMVLTQKIELFWKDYPRNIRQRR